MIQKGSQLWKLRSKHGRDKLFATPELMWEAACEYFQWCEDNPLVEVDFRGKDVTEVKLPKMRPFTLQGLCLYLDCGSKYFNHFEEDVRDKTDDLSKAFLAVINKIREVIYDQKFTGAASGFFNPNIIWRDLGLSEKTQQIHVEQPLFNDDTNE